MLAAPRRIGVTAAVIAEPTLSGIGVGMMQAPLALVTNAYLAGVTGCETEYLSDTRRNRSDELARQFAAAHEETASGAPAPLHSPIDAQPDERKNAVVAEVDRQHRDFVWE
jgi:hypothetical protein